MIATLLALICAYLGMLIAALCQRSRRAMIARAPTDPLRRAAWLVPGSLLTLSVALFVRGQGPAFGGLLILETTPLICCAVALTVRRPRRAFHLARLLTAPRQRHDTRLTP